MLTGFVSCLHFDAQDGFQHTSSSQCYWYYQPTAAVLPPNPRCSHTFDCSLLDHSIRALYPTSISWWILWNAHRCTVRFVSILFEFILRKYNRCANIGWELVYGTRLPFTLTQFLVFVPWVVIDAFLVYTTMRFGPKQWKHAPMIAQNLTGLLVSGLVMMVFLHWSFAVTYDEPDLDAMFWSAFALQAFLGASSVAQIMSRDNTSGHSMDIWWVDVTKV